MSVTRPEGGGGYSHIKVTGMLVGKLKLNRYGRPMCVWHKLKLTPKTDILIRVKDLKKKGLVVFFFKNEISVKSVSRQFLYISLSTALSDA